MIRIGHASDEFRVKLGISVKRNADAEEGKYDWNAEKPPCEQAPARPAIIIAGQQPLHHVLICSIHRGRIKKGPDHHQKHQPDVLGLIHLQEIEFIVDGAVRF